MVSEINKLTCCIRLFSQVGCKNSNALPNKGSSITESKSGISNCYSLVCTCYLVAPLFDSTNLLVLCCSKRSFEKTPITKLRFVLSGEIKQPQSQTHVNQRCKKAKLVQKLRFCKDLVTRLQSFALNYVIDSSNLLVV